MSGRRPIALVGGYALRFPLGGMTWVYLNYLLGLAGCGFEPVYVEAALWPESCYDPARAEMTDDPSYGIAHLRRGAAGAGLADLRVAYQHDDGRTFGMTAEELEAVLAGAEVLVNVGASTWHPSWAAVECRVLVDCDAPFTQIAIHRGVEPITGIAANHGVLATTGVNVAGGGAGIPLHRTWLPTRPPVHTPAWEVTPLPEQGAWSTVTSWGSGARTEWQERQLGNKADGYADLVDLPGIVRVPLELAVASDAPAEELLRKGWRVVDPVGVTSEAEVFASYVSASRGELAVAKHAYSSVRSGAMNDRSLAYMAAGRPVVASDTGAGIPGTGEGFLTFSDALGAAEAIAAVEENPDHHASAARRIAERDFEAAEVLADLLGRAGVALPEKAPA